MGYGDEQMQENMKEYLTEKEAREKETLGVRPHKEKINISKEIINKTRRAVAPYAARMNHTPLRGEQ